MTYTPKDWKNRPFAPNPGETIEAYDTRLAAYAAANPSLVTAMTAEALEDMETRLAAYADQASSGGGYLTHTIPSTLEVGPGAVPLALPRAGQLATVVTAIAAPPIAGAVTIDVNLNGTTVFTSQENRPTIPAGEAKSQVAVPDIIDFAAGDVLTIDVDEVGGVVAEVVQEITPVNTTTTQTFDIAGAATEVADGDLLIYICRNGYVASSPATITPGQTWESIGKTDNATASFSVDEMWRLHDDAITTYTFTHTTNSPVAPRIFHIRNALAGGPIDVTSTDAAASTATNTFPSLLPAVDNELYLAHAHMLTSRIVSGPPQNMTLVRPAGHTTSTSLWVWHRKLGDLGVASGTRNVVFSGSDSRIIGGMLIKPDPDAAGVEKGSHLTVAIGLA
jgi:hypothetical protein